MPQRKPPLRLRLKFTDDIRSEIAEARIQGLLDGPDYTLTPIEKVVKDLALETRLGFSLEERKSVRFAVSAAFHQALEKGLVRVDVRRTVAQHALQPDVRARDQLLYCYPTLHDAVVIKHLQGAGDDAVHESLGEAMAQFIATKVVFQRDDVVGVGSGRGVEKTIQALRQNYPRLRAENVKALSLTGSVYSTPTSTTRRLWFDSDAHTKDFSECFESGAAPYLICHPLAFSTSEELSTARKRVWLGAPSKGADTPPVLTHLLVGVGVFSGQHPHRFYNEANVENKGEPFLRPIHKLLIELKELCDPIIGVHEGNTGYYPVAEMSNLFIFVPPPKGIMLPEETAIKRKLSAINSRLLTIKEDQLRGAQMLVVAGPKRKAHALRALLTSQTDGSFVYPVKYLCTTSDTARDLIAASKV